MTDQTTQARAIRDTIALITGGMASPEPDIDHTLQHILDDITATVGKDPHLAYTLGAFIGVIRGLLGDLADATHRDRGDLWQDLATRITRTADNLTDLTPPSKED